MARWTFATYNRFLGRSMSGYGLTRKEAAQHYRNFREALGRSPSKNALKAHPRIAARTAEHARLYKPAPAPAPRRPGRAPVEPAVERPSPPAPPPVPEEELEEELDEDFDEGDSSSDENEY
jgi:hypothetical protein